VLLNFQQYAVRAHKKSLKKNTDDYSGDYVGQVYHGLEKAYSLDMAPVQYIGKKKAKGDLSKNRYKHNIDIVSKGHEKIMVFKNIPIGF